MLIQRNNHCRSGYLCFVFPCLHEHLLCDGPYDDSGYSPGISRGVFKRDNSAAHHNDGVSDALQRKCRYKGRLQNKAFAWIGIRDNMHKRQPYLSKVPGYSAGCLLL